MNVCVKDWLELTMADRVLILEQVAEQQRQTGCPVQVSDIDEKMQQVWEGTLEREMSWMPEEEAEVFAERVRIRRLRLNMKKAALCGNTATA
ncbi:hypothetical protein DFP93_103169 [Aneurinibacillus soli]|uniref:Uncharacterized protein n=1 Tax=Aneurinibacillus soli TaxID=1500254 RepID=A0A0U5BFC9_9BACL|nr:hypothetical protein [Aneurinibacillus soli]PYE62958.1 hypothetical protein DFP93_103169 [Aneurinibacillus soli]BAU28983.1 hypothetical protein CB4_03161 [Aneurinibacillus soli]